MLRLELNPEEMHAFVDVLESTLSDLRMEIAGTDRQEFRDMLKVRKPVLQKVLETLQQQQEVAAQV